MKAKLVLVFLLVGLTFGCKKENTDAVTVEMIGEIRKLEASYFMYGTHIIISNNSNYALTSNTIDLNKYLSRQVTLKATKTPGYPIEGGPDYYNVIQVK